MSRTPNSMSMRIPPLLLALAACCSTAVMAQAAAPSSAPKTGTMTWIGDLDRNHDGRITVQEAAVAPVIAKDFAAIDANHDGAITMSEVRAQWHALYIRQAQASVRARMRAFDKADTNHDGKLSVEEANVGGMHAVVANFKAIDSNHDDSIGKDEMLNAAQVMARRELAARGQYLQALFTKADTNHDGKLSRAEFAAAFPRFAPSFAFFDENHDGFVEPGEFALPPGF